MSESERPKPKPPERPLTANKGRRLDAVFRQHAPTSRCTQARAVPLEWQIYRGRDGDVAEEILKPFSVLSDLDRQLALAEIASRMEAAALGRLEDGTELKPILIDPELWELRFRIGGLLYRLYFAEPHSHPQRLVGLRFHEKDVSGAQDDIDLRLQAEMGLAAMRYNSGRIDEWGYP